MHAFKKTEDILWLCLLLTLPVTASPLLPFGGGTLVRPLSFLPAIALVGLALLRRLVLRQPFRLASDGSGWLLAFTFYVIAGGLAVVSLLSDDRFKGQAPLDSLLRALVTLAVGLCFYFAARLRLRTMQDVARALRWLSLGVGASIGLAVLQVVAMQRGGALLQAVQAVTDLFAVHYDGLVNRAQGMTFEPSWLAVQIMLLILPPALAALISRQPAAGAPPRRGVPWTALGLLALAVTGLLCAGSRVGLGGAVVTLAAAAGLAALRGRALAALALAAVLVAGAGGLAAMSRLSTGAGSTYVLGPVQYALSGTVSGSDATEAVGDIFAIAGRAAAAQAAFALWQDHPWFGVSLGNNYRFFGRYAPDWAFDGQLFNNASREGVGWLDPNSPEKGNAKNLVLRLLSETGLVGFGLWGLFVLRQLFSAPARDDYYAVFRLSLGAGLLFGALNQDSFADPAPWVMLVLAAAMGRLQAPRAEARA